MDDIYTKLRKKLDRVGFGYPATEAGTEYVFLKEFYSEKDAEIIIAMKDGYQTPAEFAQMTGMDVSEAEERLYSLSKRGLIYREKVDGKLRYCHVPIVHGTYEFNIKNFDNIWLTPFFQTLGAPGFRETMYRKEIPFFRAIPGKSDLVDGEILPYDDIEQILDDAQAYAITPCACRTNPKFRDAPVCGHPTDTCLTLDGFADYAVENGFGYYVTRDEAIKMLWNGLVDHRVIQVINSKKAEVICSCCGCSCGVIRARKQFDNMDLWSNYYAARDADKCTQCSTCETYCQVGAITPAKLDLGHCVGCGLCVHNCPSKALKLVKKERTFEPSETVFDTYNVMSELKEADKRAKKIE